MVFHDAVEQLEPEDRNLRQHGALVRNFVFQNVIERGNAVGRDEQQLVAEIVQVAHLALRIGPDVDNAHVFAPFIGNLSNQPIIQTARWLARDSPIQPRSNPPLARRRQHKAI